MSPGIASELGVVCDRCGGYAPLGIDACPLCSETVSLVMPKAAIAPPASSVGGPATDRDGSLAPPSVVVGEPPPPKAARHSVRVEQRTDTRDMQEARMPAVVIKDALTSTRSDGSSGVAPHLFATLALERRRSPLAPPAGKTLEEWMDQAKHYVCGSCSSGVPLSHKFCGRCGAAVPPEILNARTQFFGQLQSPGRAKLILIRGEGIEGLSYQLNSDQHVVGKTGHMVFPDDPFISPKHANFFYRNDKLVVRDEGSVNGVYVRIKTNAQMQPGDTFVVGEQVFRVDAVNEPDDKPAPDGTHFYTSPKIVSTVAVSQMLQGGSVGITVYARGSSLQIGREGGDVNFPTDLFMSSAHCKLECTSGVYTLTDMSSRNGTYVRIHQERELAHGDYIFIGKKLLRVEITAA